MMLAVSFNANGTRLAAGGTDNAIRIWDTASGRQERLIEQHADWVMALAFNHADTLLASASRDKSVRLFDPTTGEMEHSYLEHGDAVFGVAFSSDDKSVYSCGRDKRIHVWSVKEAKKNAQISGFEEEVYRVIVTAQHIFSCSADKRVRQHATADKNELIRTFAAAEDVVHALAFQPGTRRLAAGSFDGKIHVWNTDTGELIVKFTAAPGALAAQAK
jgi:WD40 repeat protein